MIEAFAKWVCVTTKVAIELGRTQNLTELEVHIRDNNTINHGAKPHHFR